MINTDTKKYRLLKDLPDAKIGTEFIEDNDDNCYNYTSIHGEGCWYNKHYIENTPEWFEEVLPESIPNKQEERIEVIFVAETQKFSDGTCDYMFQLSKEVITDKFPAIKKAIEAAINGDTAGIYQSIKDNAPVINYEKNANLDSKLIYEEKPNQSTTPIEDKGWEILSFKGETGLLELDDNKWKYRNSLNSISDIDFLISLYPIHSVRRTSDNEVFTVGDKIGWGIDGSYETTLLGFEIQDGRLKFNDSKKPEHYRWTDFLNALKLHKKSFQPQDKGNVLFTTYDGVDYYEDNKGAWWVDVRDFRIGHQSRISKEGASNNNFKYFSNEQAAKDWVLENKPCLSLVDVMNVIESKRWNFSSETDPAKIYRDMRDATNKKLNQ